MKIVFWSPLHGQTCTTSALISMAMSIALQQKGIKTVVVQSHFSMNQMDYAFLGDSAKKNVLIRRGLDALFDASKSGDFSKETVLSCLVDITDNLQLVTAASQVDQGVYAVQMDSMFGGVINALDKYFELTFVDVNAGYSKTSVEIRDKADILVVCLNQNQTVLVDFFDNHYAEVTKVIAPSRIFYLFGNYSLSSKNTMRNLAKKYRQLKPTHCGAIIHNPNFMDAVSEGEVLRFFKKNVMCDKFDVNYPFVSNLDAAASKLLALVRKCSTQRGGMYGAIR